MRNKLPLALVAAGAIINVADAYTARGSAAGGYFFGPTGILKAVNDRVPGPNLGLWLILAGAGLWAYRTLR